MKLKKLFREDQDFSIMAFFAILLLVLFIVYFGISLREENELIKDYNELAEKYNTIVDEYPELDIQPVEKKETYNEMLHVYPQFRIGPPI